MRPWMRFLALAGVQVAALALVSEHYAGSLRGADHLRVTVRPSYVGKKFGGRVLYFDLADTLLAGQEDTTLQKAPGIWAIYGPETAEGSGTSLSSVESIRAREMSERKAPEVEPGRTPVRAHLAYREIYFERSPVLRLSEASASSLEARLQREWTRPVLPNARASKPPRLTGVADLLVREGDVLAVDAVEFEGQRYGRTGTVSPVERNTSQPDAGAR